MGYLGVMAQIKWVETTNRWRFNPQENDLAEKKHFSASYATIPLLFIIRFTHQKSTFIHNGLP
jgi:hypothetical protein